MYWSYFIKEPTVLGILLCRTKILELKFLYNVEIIKCNYVFLTEKNITKKNFWKKKYLKKNRTYGYNVYNVLFFFIYVRKNCRKESFGLVSVFENNKNLNTRTYIFLKTYRLHFLTYGNKRYQIWDVYEEKFHGNFFLNEKLERKLL